MPVAALVLSVCALVFVVREAGADPPAAPPDKGDSVPAARFEEALDSRSPSTGSSGRLEPLSPEPAETPGSGAQPGPTEPTAPDTLSGASDGREPRAPEEPAPGPDSEGTPAKPASALGASAPEESGSSFGNEPALFEEPAPGAGALEEIELAPEPATGEPVVAELEPAGLDPAARAEEAPVPPAVLLVPGYEEREPVSGLEPGGASSAVPGSSGEVPEVDALGAFVGGSLLWPTAGEGGDVVGAVMEGLYSGVESGLALVASVGGPEPSPAAPPQEGTSPESAPPPPALPPLLPDSDSFSLSGSGELGAGCAGPLLLCILVLAALVTRRRNGKLSRVFCEFMKPTSALLLPLERPG